MGAYDEERALWNEEKAEEKLFFIPSNCYETLFTHTSRTAGAVKCRAAKYPEESRGRQRERGETERERTGDAKGRKKKIGQKKHFGSAIRRLQ